MPRYFTDEHEWIDVEDDAATVGITDYAQEQLGDIVFVELPAVGTALDKGGDAAVVESVKAASDVYAPISGEVTEGNESLSPLVGRCFVVDQVDAASEAGLEEASVVGLLFKGMGKERVLIIVQQ